MGVKRALRRWFRSRKARAAYSSRLEGFAAWQKFHAPSPRVDRLVRELTSQVPTDLRFTFVLSARAGNDSGTLASLLGQSYANFEIILLGAEDRKSVV